MMQQDQTPFECHSQNVHRTEKPLSAALQDMNTHFFKKHKFKENEAQNAEILKKNKKHCQADINKHNWKNYVF